MASRLEKERRGRDKIIFSTGFICVLLKKERKER
jgi:hypothetical protein